MQLVRKETNTELLEGKRLKELEMNSDFVLCKFSDGSICKAGIVIGADGANSVVKRYVERETNTNENSCAAVRAYVEGVSGLQEGTNEFYYLKNYLPGYLWIFPLKDGAANIGFGMEMKKTKSVNLREMFLKIIQEEPIISSRFKNAKIVGEVKGFGLPMFSTKRKISAQRVLLCGDAASLIDPLMGHGIDKAFTSRYLAAKQIELCFKNNDFSMEYAALYDQSVYSAVGSELKRSKQLVQLINRSPFVINVFAKLAQNKRVFNWLVKVVKI